MTRIGPLAVSDWSTGVPSSPAPSAAAQPVSAPRAVAPRVPLPIECPLVIELHGALLRTGLVSEVVAAALRRSPLALLGALFSASRGALLRPSDGGAGLSRALAGLAAVDVDTLPVRAELVALAENEAAEGRTVVLRTGADELLARRIAARFPFVSQVAATGEDGAAALARRFSGGFAYATDDGGSATARLAAAVVTVDAGPRARARVEAIGRPALHLGSRPSPLGVLARGLRLRQWAKNALVFAPLVLAGRYAEPQAWLLAAAAFLGLGLVASATYLVNDLLDLDHDRRHWSKKDRPLASGALSIASAAALVPALAAAGLTLGIAAGPAVGAILVAYAGATLGYSAGLKRVPIVDVAVLASLFTLRLFLGVAAVGAAVSPWLFVFSMALFLSLSIAKRHTEVVRMRLEGGDAVRGRGYVARDEPLLLAMGLAAAGAAVVLFSLYVTAEAARIGVYAAPGCLWAVPVTLFLWLGRMWLLSGRGELDDDPVAFALRDAPSLSLGGAVAAAFVAAVVGVLP